MPIQNHFMRSVLRSLIASAALVFFASTHAQSTALLEACNAVEDKEKRLACFKELSTLKTSPAPSSVAASKKVKDAFAAVAGAIGSGVSLRNYSVLLLEPSKELEIFRQEKPTPNQHALDLYGEALLAYRDAEAVWHASIFESEDGGMFFGKILNPHRTGLQGIVNRYNLPTREVLLNTHLPAEEALEFIWRRARERAQAANEAIERAPIDQADVSIYEKKGWVKVISELNGCDSPIEIALTKNEGVREFYSVNCANKRMEVQCEFIGPVFTGIKGIPFVKVTGKSYDNQPACWQ